MDTSCAHWFVGFLMALCIFILEITRITQTRFLSKRNLGEISFGGVSGVRVTANKQSEVENAISGIRGGWQ